MELRLGPSGIGGKEEAEANLEVFAKMGLKAAEIAFTYGVYLDEENALRIGERAKKLDISLSIHAPYFVNLNSLEKVKVEASKKRILDCCRVGHYLALAWKGKRKTSIVIHPGYYSNMGSSQALENIKKQVLELMEEVKKNKWEVTLCFELMGKINVFGSIDEISQLVDETGCGCCIDFAHVLARYQGDRKLEEIRKAFEKLKVWHVHFSGIVYGDKGEKNHRHTEEKEWKELFEFFKTLKGMKEIVVVCEAPNPSGDAVEGLKVSKKILG
ncbi:TIM barrel protein [Candidatus Pacearchaeota archaeon]|nr:TIM barrel protein [Candidatus Pacearchaeota archaeon]